MSPGDATGSRARCRHHLSELSLRDHQVSSTEDGDGDDGARRIMGIDAAQRLTMTRARGDFSFALASRMQRIGVPLFVYSTVRHVGADCLQVAQHVSLHFGLEHSWQSRKRQTDTANLAWMENNVKQFNSPKLSANNHSRQTYLHSKLQFCCWVPPSRTKPTRSKNPFPFVISQSCFSSRPMLNKVGVSNAHFMIPTSPRPGTA